MTRIDLDDVLQHPRGAVACAAAAAVAALACPGQVQVLLDRVEVNDPSSAAGDFNFAGLLTTGIDRIEVLRVFDEDYQEALGFTAAGRSAFGGLELSF